MQDTAVNHHSESDARHGTYSAPKAQTGFTTGKERMKRIEQEPSEHD